MDILELIEFLLPYITVGLILIILIILVVAVAKISRVNRKMGDQDFEILESIKKDEAEVLYFDMTVSNKAFSTNYLNTVGFKKGNVIQILAEVNATIPPRTKHSLSLPMEQLKTLTIKDANKFKKITLFAENELGLRQESKGKLINKYLKWAYKEDKRNERKLAKQERFETGNYKFRERFGLIIKLFFRPFYKLFARMRQSTNVALKESEIRRIYKAEHDKIERNLILTTAQANELKIKEEIYSENKTKESMLELLKQEKILELQNIKLSAYEKAFEEKKEEILSINPQEEFEKYVLENPINFDNIEADVLRALLNEVKENIENKEIIDKKSKTKKDKKIDEPTEEISEVVKDEQEELDEKVEEVETPIKEDLDEKKEPSKKEDKINLESLKVSELKDLAKEKGVKYYGTMKKKELIDALKKLD